MRVSDRLSRHRRRIELVVGIRFRLGEGVTDGLRILGSEHDPQDLTMEAAVLKDFLADQLTLAVAVRGKPRRGLPTGGQS